MTGWTGNNGGATYQGVTANTIRVAFYATGSSGDDYTTSAPAPSDSPGKRTIKTLLRFFQSHFETYGRTVDLYLVPDNGNDSTVGAKNTLQTKPFAAIDWYAESAGAYQTYLSQLAAGGVVGFVGLNHTTSPTGSPVEVPRSFLVRNAPYVWTVAPDIDTVQASEASLICNELAGQRASRASDPTLAASVRRFAILYGSAPGGQAENANSLRAGLQSRCGLQLTDFIGDPTTTFPPDPAGQAAIIARLQGDHVTTVIDMDAMQLEPAAAAAAPPYEPEWLQTQEDGIYDQASLRERMNPSWAGNETVPSTEASANFGINWQWTVPALPETYWFQAYSEINADGQFAGDDGPSLYLNLLQLFTAIQRAGPVLNPSSLQAGLESLDRPSIGASPHAYYAPGNHAFIHDAALQRWSNTDLPPGSSYEANTGAAGPGCYEQIAGGARHGSEGWPPGDHIDDGATCGADFFLSNSNTQQGEAW